MNFKNGTGIFGKDCGMSMYCSDTKKGCNSHNATGGVKDCKIECCQSKLCNDNFPSGASRLIFQLVPFLAFVASLALFG